MIIIDKEYMENTTREDRRVHLDLNEPCLERGGKVTEFRGVLASYLNTNFPKGRFICCHACSNALCSNPKHLYWGSDHDNYLDKVEAGNWLSPTDLAIDKHGEEKWRSMLRKKKPHKGVSPLKSEEHKRKIADSATGKLKYTNGIENITLNQNENPPIGFYRGMTRKKKK